MHASFHKNVLALFLVLVLLFVSGGSLLIYKLWIQKIRHDVKWKVLENLPEEELVLVKLPADCFSNPPSGFKVHHSKEFEYKGEMYDIVSKTVKGDSLYAYCYHDSKETAVRKQMEEYVSFAWNDDSLPHSKKEVISQTLLQKYLPAGIAIRIFEKAHQLEFNFLSSCFSVPVQPPVPPPKAIS